MDQADIDWLVYRVGSGDLAGFLLGCTFVKAVCGKTIFNNKCGSVQFKDVVDRMLFIKICDISYLSLEKKHYLADVAVEIKKLIGGTDD